MATGLLQLGNWLLLIGAVLFIVAVFKAFRAGRQLRAAAYYSVRQDALSRTRRWAFLATLILVATGALAVYLSNQLPPSAIAIASTPTSIVIATPSRLLATFTSTPLPAETSSPMPLPTSTPLPTQLPTATLPPNLPAILQTPVPSAVPASPSARLVFTTLASMVDGKGTPADPGLAFPAGSRTVRLFFQASNVNNGAVWSVLCYKGSNLVDSVVDLWKWGPRTQVARAFCGLDGSPGTYSVSAYLGPAKQFEITFELLSATPTPLPPVTPQ